MSRRPGIIVERLGADNAKRLSSIVGGTRLSVPGLLANADRLKRLVGDDLAVLLVLHFGDSRFYVPTGGPRAPVETAKVKRLSAKGHSSARIARALGCSERTVDAKLAKLRSRKPTHEHKSGKANGRTA